jgi:hypothetical protein
MAKSEDHNLQEIKDQDSIPKIIERTGSNMPDKQGLVCPHCGAHEVYANPQEPNNINQWYWMIRAFKVDDWSFCNNCDGGFQC